MDELKDPPLRDTSHTHFHEKLVACILALEQFLSEIRFVSGPEEVFSLTLRHLRTLLPLKTAGFYFPDPKDQIFVLRTKLDGEEAAALARSVDQAIDSGVFGWALHHTRPAAFQIPGGQTTLILAALRTRRRVLGMFAALFDTPSASGWDTHTIVLATYLACAADAILSEELTLELQEQNRQLDSLVQERTLQLQEAKEAAEIANRTKSAFLATVSHELRTPLNAILGYSQILIQEEPLSSRQSSQMRIIRRSAEHLLSLINDLLDISKAESSQVELAPRSVSLPETLLETVAIIRPQADKKGLKFQCTIDTRIPPIITVDPRRLTQVILNLLHNAIKFTETGSVELRVAPAGQAIQFAISDTGCGIAPHDLPNLFKPFQQFGTASKRAEGTGLGLSVSKKILHAMGVELRVQSTPSLGSVFVFELRCPDCSVESPGPVTTCPPEPALPKEEKAVAGLPAEEIQHLKTLVAGGDIIGLRQALERLVSLSSPPHPEVEKLLLLAATCEVKAIRTLLEKL